jgi:HTH-type transcriptional regulator/antitoxin HipB
MIRNKSEYELARKQLKDEQERVHAHWKLLEKEGLTAGAIERVIAPMKSFQLLLREDIDNYTRACSGDFRELNNFENLGQLLIGLRIHLGLSQRELARRLEIDESQVSRDERNEYRNATIDRVQKILQVLGVSLVTRVDLLAKKPCPKEGHDS